MGSAVRVTRSSAQPRRSHPGSRAARLHIVTPSLDLVCRVCGDSPLAVRHVLAITGLGDDAVTSNLRWANEGMTERYINIEHFVVPQFDDAMSSLIDIAEHCRQHYGALFAYAPITTHELYCALFNKDRKDAALVLLTPENMQRLCDMRTSVALNVYQAD